jgi:hypothetical protein
VLTALTKVNAYIFIYKQGRREKVKKVIDIEVGCAIMIVPSVPKISILRNC